MANTTITGLAAATTLSGTEVLPVDQNGSTVKTTVQDIANLAGGGGGLTMPTLTVVPAPPSYAPIKYFSPAIYNINGQTVQASKYGVETSFITSGATGSYYNTNKITQFSTDATVIDYIPFYQLDTAITSISLPTVQLLSNSSGMTNDIFIDQTSQLQSVSLPNLQICNNTNIQGSQINSLDFSSLFSVDNTLQIQYISNGTAISFPQLQNISQSLTIGGFATPTLSFPQLKVVGYTIDFSLGYLGAPVSLNLSSLESFYAITINSTDLTSFALPSLKSVGICTNNQFYTSLDQTSVDNVLTAFAALDGTNGTSNWSCGSIYIAGGNSAPSATGLAAINTLINRGISVTYNP